MNHPISEFCHLNPAVPHLWSPSMTSLRSRLTHQVNRLGRYKGTCAWITYAQTLQVFFLAGIPGIEVNIYVYKKIYIYTYKFTSYV